VRRPDGEEDVPKSTVGNFSPFVEVLEKLTIPEVVFVRICWFSKAHYPQAAIKTTPKEQPEGSPRCALEPVLPCAQGLARGRLPLGGEAFVERFGAGDGMTDFKPVRKAWRLLFDMGPRNQTASRSPIWDLPAAGLAARFALKGLAEKPRFCQLEPDYLPAAQEGAEGPG